MMLELEFLLRCYSDPDPEAAARALPFGSAMPGFGPTRRTARPDT